MRNGSASSPGRSPTRVRLPSALVRYTFSSSCPATEVLLASPKEKPKLQAEYQWILSSKLQFQKANHRAARPHGLSSWSLACPRDPDRPVAGFLHTPSEGDPRSSLRSLQDASPSEQLTSQS